MARISHLFHSIFLTGSVFLITTILFLHSAHALDEDEWQLDLGFEIKTHYRDSEDTRFSLSFPRGAELRTVDPGTHFELSSITLFSDIDYQEKLHLRAKVDFFDLYDRNSTSDDKKGDVDEFWLRFGSEVKSGMFPQLDGNNLYFKLGKFGKYERQNDRHLESYGLVSTAFNRFEDQGVELGIDITKNLYIKGSITTGNPVFMRDTNALAGDHGTADLIFKRDPDLNNGFPIIYDAEVEDFDFHDNFSEKGLGMGFRFANEESTRRFDILLFGYERELKDTSELFGTLYGGDLDIFDVRTNEVPTLPADIVIGGLKSDYKREYGTSLWIYYDDFTLFGQFVQQDIGGLDRKGWELELSRKIFLPEFLTIHHHQIFTSISPSVRYSYLNPNFSGSSPSSPFAFPAPSFTWQWKKFDVGFRINILPGLNLTLEYAFNNFETAAGSRSNDEFLSTLKWRYIF